VLLARWLATHPRVLMLDEPTRGIDIGTKSEVQALIDDLAVGRAGGHADLLRPGGTRRFLRPRPGAARWRRRRSADRPNVTEKNIMALLAAT
jgi:monosaccharide-transporting ATPase